MDIFEYRATKVVNIEGVFEAFKGDEGDLGGLFMRLKNLTISELHTQWDIAYLNTYIKNQMVPQSLRREVSPQQGDVQLEDWFAYFNTAGIEFLKFLVGRKNNKLVRLDEEIKTIKDKLTPFKESTDYQDKSSSLLKILDKEDKDQRIKKKKKYNRDLGDYQGVVVFEWQKKLLADQTNTINEAMEIGAPASNSVVPPSDYYIQPHATSRRLSRTTPER